MYKICTNEKLLQYADLLVESNAIIALDTETQGLFPLTDRVVGFSFSWKPGFAVYVPVRHIEGHNCPQDIVCEFFERVKKIRIVMHNAKFDKAMIYTSFGKNLPVFADTMIYAALLSEPKGLKDLSFKFLNIKQRHFSDLMKEKFGAKWNSLGYTVQHINSDDPELLDYACCDADYTFQIFNILYPKMKPFKNVLKIEENLIDIIVRLNLTGAPVDKEMLEKAIVDFEKHTEQLYDEICEVAGRQLAINSPRDLGNFLFGSKQDGGLALPVIERSQKTGAPSTSKEVLAELSEMHPVVEKIDAWRKDTRMLKAYLKKIPAGVDENNNIFTEFDPLGAVSGRFTSSSIEDKNGLCRGLNLQNIPKHKKRAIDMRAAFVAPEGWTFVKADYSQIEYRVMACLSRDQYMCQSFRNGVDFHTFTAHMMYEIPVEEVTSEQRDMGKVFNFGLSYGMTAKGLSWRLGCSEEEAERKIEIYFSKLPNLVGLINSTKQRALQNQATSTFFGRTRPIILDGLPVAARDKMLRRSFNTMIQGTAADFLKIALLRVNDRVLQKYKGKVKFILTVHDELDFIVKNEYRDEILYAIKQAMEVPTPADWVPLVADVEYGSNWSDESHVKFDPADYKREEFTSWGAVLPQGLKTSIDDLLNNSL